MKIEPTDHRRCRTEHRPPAAPAPIRRGRTIRRVRSLLALTGLACALALAPASPASAATVVPDPIAKWLLSHVGAAALDQYTCQGNITCYINGAYDPPQWGHGTIQTGGVVLRTRSWTTTQAPIVQTFPDGWRLTIFCQTTGQWVYGRWGWTNVWDYIGQLGDTPRFVSDGYVYTGTNGYVAGSCASTNYGGMWT